MASAKLWIEMVIAGSFYAVAAFFLSLWCLGINSLCFLWSISGIAPYLSVAALFVFYLFGLAAHFISQRIVEWLLGKGDNHQAQSLGFIDSLSERVYREIKACYNAFVLLRLVAAGSVLLGISLALWVQLTTFKDYWLKIMIVCTFLGFFFSFAYLSFRKRVIERKEEMTGLWKDWQQRNSSTSSS